LAWRLGPSRCGLAELYALLKRAVNRNRERGEQPYRDYNFVKAGPGTSVNERW